MSGTNDAVNLLGHAVDLLQQNVVSLATTSTPTNASQPVPGQSLSTSGGRSMVVEQPNLAVEDHWRLFS